MDVDSKENIDLLACGSTALEVNCHHVRNVETMERLAPYLQNFDYVSLHTPCDTRYKNDDETRLMLKKIETYCLKYNIQLAVVHPDLVDDWSVFDEFKLNWAAENMDNRKASFRTVESMKTFLDAHPNWGMVLDVGHCNVNDKTMGLAYEFIAELKDRIKEIHLSGYEVFHDPLHRTKQAEIIESCKKLDVPIIIESTFEETDGVEGIKKEFDYILDVLK